MSDQQKSTVGLRDLYYAPVTQDDVDAYAAGTPAIFAPAVAASHKPKNSSKIQYADDGAFDTLTAEGETEIELETTNIPANIQAIVLGKVFDTATGRVFDNAGGAVAPDVALGFRTKKSNGSYKYFWYLKGKFSQPDEEQATQGESPEPKTLKIKFTAVKTTYQFDLGDINDGVKRVWGDEDDTDFDGDTWFDDVQVPVAGSPSAFTCTPDPADGASGVSVSANIVLTFSNPLQSGMEDRILLTEDDGTLKAVTRSINAARTVVTLDPTTNLSASTTYLVTLAGVKDVYGQALGDTVYDLTTA